LGCPPIVGLFVVTGRVDDVPWDLSTRGAGSRRGTAVTAGFAVSRFCMNHRVCGFWKNCINQRVESGSSPRRMAIENPVARRTPGMGPPKGACTKFHAKTRGPWKGVLATARLARCSLGVPPFRLFKYRSLEVLKDTSQVIARGGRVLTLTLLRVKPAPDIHSNEVP